MGWLQVRSLSVGLVAVAVILTSVAPGNAAMVCTTVTTDTVDGTALTGTNEGSSGYVTYNSTQYLKNNNYSPNCKYIANHSPTTLPVYVPAAKQAEWASFVSRTPNGVTLSECTYETYESCYDDGSSSGDSGGGSLGYGDHEGEY